MSSWWLDVHSTEAAPISLSSPHKWVNKRRGNCTLGCTNAHTQILPIHVASHLPCTIVSCNCFQININHIFWPEYLFEWTPNDFFSILFFPLLLCFTFCYFFSFVGVHHPSHHEGHPTVCLLFLVFVIPSFPAACQSCQLGWLRHSSADPLSIQMDSSSHSSFLYHVARQQAYWKGFFLFVLFGDINFLLHYNHFKHTFRT